MNDILESPLTATVKAEWKAFSNHVKTCKECRPFYFSMMKGSVYRLEIVESCCEEGTNLVLAWRGAIDDLKRDWKKRTAVKRAVGSE